MRWQNERQSDNIDDRRGMRVTGKPLALGGTGIVLMLVVGLLMGKDPASLIGMVLNGMQANSAQIGNTQQPDDVPSAEDEKLKAFSATILASTEDVWSKLFTANQRTYQQPKLVLFSGAVESTCGLASAAVGPFYCPGDKQVYLDLSFFSELTQRFNAPGDFAQAYVIAHEVGHHVQKLMGTSDTVHAEQRGLDEDGRNALSVKLELQADCYAGVWAYHANQERHWLEEGDVEEALHAATAIGDDTLQKQAQGYVRPETFTHGSAAERVQWFKRGMAQGNTNDCNTF